MPIIIPEDERSDEKLDTERVIYHPDMIRANEWVLSEYEPPVRKTAVFVPCAKRKPYHTSPSHKMYDRIIFGILKPEDVHVVVFGTCGITPREIDTEYPFTAYSFVLGKCNVASIKRDFIKMESERLARYLEKTRHNYEHRIAYCVGDFRTAMEKAVEMVDLNVTIVPKPATLEKNINPTKHFIYGSLSQPDYLQDLSDAFTSVLGIPKREVGFNPHLSENDNDWYLL
jgi:predicted RNA-binding protein